MSKIFQLYKPADEYFIVNDNDPDLLPIKIPLPKPPDDLRTVEGYGLHPEDQLWRPPIYPKKLKDVEKKVIDRLRKDSLRNAANRVTGQKINSGIYQEIKANKEYYRDEIKWIRQQWHRRLFGHWLFINGKPTYLDGWHYFYCGFWHLDVGLPEYRDRDRRWFLFARFCYNDTKGFAKYNKDGFAIPEEDGTFIQKDYGRRVCFGFAYPKHRRDGATYKVLDVGYEIISRTKGVFGGLQSFDDDNAQSHFQEKLVPAWRKLPFFFRPNWSGSERPADSLNFVSPANLVGESELESALDFATTADRKFYDGKKLYFYHAEEEGKCRLEDINARWDIIKKCLAQGKEIDIHGFSIHPTTVRDMEDKNGRGGMAFYKLCNDSNYYQRLMTNGQTYSGLYRLFIPGYDGMEGFIGRFGESIIDTPTPEQALFIKKDYGAKHYIMEEREMLLRKGTPEAMEKYYRIREETPICWADCFNIMSGNMGFNEVILDKRIAELRRQGTDYYTRGNFEWVGGIRDGKVTFVRDEVAGRWEVYKLLPDNQTSLKFKHANSGYLTGYSWVPASPEKFTAGGDPYQFLTRAESGYMSDKSKLSKGGGAIFEERDMRIDPETKPISDWETHNFVATYSCRPKDDDQYAEDMLLACVYYGSMMYPERNVKLIVKYFCNRGYQAFLKHDIDEYGVIAKEPGVHSLLESKDKLFKGIRTYIEWHGHRCKSLSFLMQCKEIRLLEEMKKYDLFTACGCALMGSQSQYAKLITSKSEPTSYRQLFKSNFV